ncbi:hypothetical protein CHS0354_009264 [Potamilus streckersoni]|uniref:Uncharacterized protein n=1 Tax=Potamilus streckersoni TaxID=2493646 RepID=A0AAE0SYT9_9BIVA|nr:hypothetical protein CHS0354_009264 [Potamilus streckersoni]
MVTGDQLFPFLSKSHRYLLTILYVDFSRISPMETVWLKDVTTTIQTDKRTIGDHGLPAQLTFHLMRGSGDMTLTLKRNYDIDPNADIYVVQRTKDGRSILTKIRNLEREVNFQ